jgi:hypothetical protein
MMNERIKLLAEQATSRPHRSQGFGGEPTHIYPGTLDPEKFAELIIKECAKVAYKYASDSENYDHYDDVGWDCLPSDLKSHIKEHFGVEK